MKVEGSGDYQNVSGDNAGKPHEFSGHKISDLSNIDSGHLTHKTVNKLKNISKNLENSVYTKADAKLIKFQIEALSIKPKGSWSSFQKLASRIYNAITTKHFKTSQELGTQYKQEILSKIESSTLYQSDIDVSTSSESSGSVESSAENEKQALLQKDWEDVQKGIVQGDSQAVVEASKKLSNNLSASTKQEAASTEQEIKSFVEKNEDTIVALVKNYLESAGDLSKFSYLNVLLSNVQAQDAKLEILNSLDKAAHIDRDEAKGIKLILLGAYIPSANSAKEALEIIANVKDVKEETFILYPNHNTHPIEALLADHAGKIDEQSLEVIFAVGFGKSEGLVLQLDFSETLIDLVDSNELTRREVSTLLPVIKEELSSIQSNIEDIDNPILKGKVESLVSSYNDSVDHLLEALEKEKTEALSHVLADNLERPTQNLQQEIAKLDEKKASGKLSSEQYIQECKKANVTYQAQVKVAEVDQKTQELVRNQEIEEAKALKIEGS